MVATTRAQVAFYGSGSGALLPWTVERTDERGMLVRIGPHRVRTSLLGEHNASNLAAAVTAAALLGQRLDRVVEAVPSLRGARGRMQRVVSRPVLGIVDYAHTPESLVRVLASARGLRPDGKVIVVAGCGGDRDREKRPAMGAAIAAADVPVFTSDNPRSERAEDIVAAMLRGVPSARRRKVTVELDRRRAIEHAAGRARAGDVILLLGKGHETTQEMDGTKHAWDDAAELRRALQAN
jgi:UDP-N-acetylmuramoyl-L-alanyl-D-glutamate--2,6-diaminopimelate ligase